MIGAAILAATFTITIPPAATADMTEACLQVVKDFRGKADTTDEECLLKLIQVGMGKVIIQTERRSANSGVDARRDDFVGKFPNPLRDAVCGDGVVDGGEECDGGPNCLPNCRNKP